MVRSCAAHSPQQRSTILARNIYYMHSECIYICELVMNRQHRLWHQRLLWWMGSAESLLHTHTHTHKQFIMLLLPVFSACVLLVWCVPV